jgi:hypothetical protein
VGELDYLMRRLHDGRVVKLSAATGAHAGPTARVAEAPSTEQADLVAYTS